MMKQKSNLLRLLAALLCAAMLLSLLPTAFAASTEEPEAVVPQMRATKSEDGIVGMWLWNDTMVSYGASNLFSHYAKTGITDVYLLIKGTYGSVNTSALTTACNAAAPYGIRVHAWIMAARDDTFLRNNSSANYFHFRTGYEWTSDSSAEGKVFGYVNLRKSAYRTYMTNLVKQLAAIDNLAGIHLDTIRYGALFYDWGMEARDLMLTEYGITHDQWNAAVQAMCVSGEYQYQYETKTTAGYNNGASYTAYTYIKSGGYTPTGPNFAEALLLNDNSDVAIGCKAVAQMRIDTVTDFVKLMKENCGDKILTAALMPESLNDEGFRGTYGQSPEHMAPYVDYITPMIYAVEFEMPSSWVAELSRAAAAVGCNVVPGLQAYQTMGSGRPTDGAWGTGKTLYGDVQAAQELAREINHDDENYGGDILGVAFFQSGTMSMASTAYDSAKQLMTFNLANMTLSSTAPQYIKAVRITLQGDLRFDSSKTSASKSYSSFTSNNTVSYSSDYKTVTISGSSTILSPQTLKSFGFYVTGTPDWEKGLCMMETATNTSFTEVLYGSSRPVFCTTAHSHSYTTKEIQKATCSQEGITLYSCSCGMSYEAKTPALPHTSVAVAAIAATCTTDGQTAGTKCSVCQKVLTGCTKIAAKGHSYVTSQGKPATCTNSGLTEGSYCSVCNQVFQAQTVIPATGHTPVVDAGYAATCTTAGMTEGSHCSVCSQVIVAQQVIAPAGHSPEVIPGTPAGCLNSGMSDGQRCSVCSQILVQQQILPRLGHEYTYTDNGNGTHTGSCVRCSKSLSPADHVVAGDSCSLCGSKVNTATPDSNIKIYHSLNLASDISVNYVVPANLLSQYDSFYMECVVPEYNGNTLAGSKKYTLQPTLNGSSYYFTLMGMIATQMNDKIEATLYMTKDGEKFCSAVDSYSICDYAYAQLAKATASESLKTLCADLLRYGSSAQIYKGYRTNALADAALSVEDSRYLSDLSAVTFGDNYSVMDDVAQPTITWGGKTLLLDAKVTLRFVFDISNYSGNVQDLSLHVFYFDRLGQAQIVTLENAVPYGNSTTRYAFDFDGLQAAELRNVVSVAVFAGDTQMTQTMQYSADTYGNGKTGTLETLCRSLIAYSDSALAYFG